MRHIIIASHARFAAGIYESIKLLAGEQPNVTTLCLFVDGNDDVASVAAQAVDSYPATDEVIAVTDLLGGSVNNEFVKLVQTRPNVHLVTNMNLPFLLQLVFADEGADTAAMLREIALSTETRVAYVNDLLSEGTDEDEEF